MRLTFDVSDDDIVILCPCGWREMAFTEAGAALAARRHFRAAHYGQGDDQMRKQVSYYCQRWTAC